MYWLKDFINNVLGPVSIIIGIITIIPVLLTWWEVTFGRRRRHSLWFREVRNVPGERPGLFIVDLLEKGNIANDVEHYRQQHEQLKGISADRIFKVNRKKELFPNDMPEIARELRQVTENIIEAGVDTLHLFYAGPVTPMALVGAEFANVRRVFLYQRNRETGMYENWGPLRHNFS